MNSWTSRVRRISSGLFCTVLCFLFSSTVVAASPTPGPNILFILVDDLGWSDVGCYGADLHETPNIDNLATQSVRFMQAYAASSICSPTRASIMTGQHPARLHMTIWHENAIKAPDRSRPWLEAAAEHNLPLRHLTIAEALRNVGYKTWHVGKWHLGDAAHYPENHGFDLNVGGTFWGAPVTFWFPYRGEFGRAKEKRYVPGLKNRTDGDYLPDQFTDEAIELIRNSDDEPFFLNLWYHTVHTPIEGKPELIEYYSAKIRPQHHHQSAAYAAMVHNMDDNVGRLLAALDESGKADNTVVVFFSDNGGLSIRHRGKFVTSNFPLRSGKGSLYEGGIREPLIVRWPGVTKPGSESQQLVTSTDLYATLAEIAGLADDQQIRHQAMDSQSLVPLLKGGTSGNARDELYWHYPHYYPTTTPVSAIRSGQWKLLYYYEEDRIELFDLSHDLSEAHDLAKDKPQKAAELRKRMDTWLANVGAQIPVPNPDYNPQ